MDRFSQKFIQQLRLLLVEDIHTLVGKNKTQEELNTILDYLIKVGQASHPDCRSHALAGWTGIDEDFKSRMTSGLVTKIDPPDYATRVNIIRHKAKVNNLVLDDSLVDLLAQHLNGDIRKIESAIIGIKAKSTLLDTPPDKTLIREVLNDLIEAPAKLNGETIRNFIGSQFKVSVEALKSRSRKRTVTFPAPDWHVPDQEIHRPVSGRHRPALQPGPLDGSPCHPDNHQGHVSRDTAVSEQIELLCGKLQNK